MSCRTRRNAGLLFAAGLTAVLNANRTHAQDGVPSLLDAGLGTSAASTDAGEPGDSAQDAGLPLAEEVAPTEPVESVVEVTPAPVLDTGANVEGAVDVTIVGGRNEGKKLMRSAEAVNVVDTKKAQQMTADLGEVLARTQGVAVRRNGGLGSSFRFAINGLYDDQIRFFLDGVPLELAGYPFGVANMPVNFIERVEIYRGVVPIRFGADALGGAVNLVTNRRDETFVGASYQIGSFGTHRATAEGRYHHAPTGLFAAVKGFVDSAKNDYDVDATVTETEEPNKGQLRNVTVPRFHDAYRAYGANVEVGVLDRAWAKRLTLSAFATTFDKELQHSIVMAEPFGDARYGETVYGSTARYEVALADGLDLELVANYAHRAIDFVDTSPWIYDWLGHRGVDMRRTPGETGNRPYDQTVWQDSGYGRALLRWQLAPTHALRAMMTPSYVARHGEGLPPGLGARDPLSAEQGLFTLVSGVEYELSLFDGRLSNIVLGKSYLFRLRGDEPRPAGAFIARSNTQHSFGVGDSLRLRVTRWLDAKASYEYAVRMPRPDEVFGNGVLVHANLKLEPERSHNGNLGLRMEQRQRVAGTFTADLNAFVRRTNNLIVLLGSPSNIDYFYQNVRDARGVGFESALSWSSIGRWVSLDGTLTYQDLRNISGKGAFGNKEGDRVPNRPYLFASWGGRLRIPRLPGERDTIEPFYYGRYVGAFFRFWESDGRQDSKDKIPTQVSHDLGVSWILARDAGNFTATFEVQNVSDAKLFDNFGVQRAGRAFYAKLTGEM